MSLWFSWSYQNVPYSRALQISIASLAVDRIACTLYSSMLKTVGILLAISLCHTETFFKFVSHRNASIKIPAVLMCPILLTICYTAYQQIQLTPSQIQAITLQMQGKQPGQSIVIQTTPLDQQSQVDGTSNTPESSQYSTQVYCGYWMW